MKVLSQNFNSASKAALLDDDLRCALDRAEGGFVNTRKKAVAELRNFEDYRTYGQQVKDHTLKHLDYYLTQFETNATKNGSQVHWAWNGEQANRIILNICAAANARKITKGKSMVSEEAVTNQSLQDQGYEVIETDLGEYIIQLAGESPSHIIAPAVHKSKQNVTDLFHAHHSGLGYLEQVTEPEDIVNQARQILRDHFCSADVGITGANFLVADTGSAVIVTNEGNGDLTASLPNVHIIIASIEKVIPDLVSLGGFLRLLGRSATGQSMSVYTTLFNGPRREDDLDGPEQFHVVLLDNGRAEILNGKYRDILRCIRCGACLNHCPVYTNIGGHAYGWVYPGPVGAVLTPLLVGQTKAMHLPNACTLNGRCETVCPVKIPLPSLLRQHRVDLAQMGAPSRTQKFGLWCWYSLASRPKRYNQITRILIAILTRLQSLKSTAARGRFRWLPLARPWTATRDFPAPAQSTFQQLRKARHRHKT
ncbi:LutB/LldF family L-lactate oxidation iron-sulfur protein [Candidatus Spongiihabitans sp.]|uniref:LutB/LldF family L-lactate oxidation iron-sulfur protein n=1 Tax=Candidatus Spongiihabitans sp. TaxID=3101308 RepID=UPI003C7E0288